MSEKQKEVETLIFNEILYKYITDTTFPFNNIGGIPVQITTRVDGIGYDIRMFDISIIMDDKIIEDGTKWFKLNIDIIKSYKIDKFNFIFENVSGINGRHFNGKGNIEINTINKVIKINPKWIKIMQ